jgi:hypothetical protein
MVLEEIKLHPAVVQGAVVNKLMLANNDNFVADKVLPLVVYLVVVNAAGILGYIYA